MELVNMEKSKPKGKSSKEVYVTSYFEKYPWGLRLTLENEELKKLKLDLKKLDIDTEVKIIAKALVTGISTDKNIENKDGARNRLELQITDLSIVNMDKFEDAFNEAVNE